jgi:hypothetical protein
MLVTIHSHLPQQRRVPGPHGGTRVVSDTSETSGMGHVLSVEAIDLPFVALKNLTPTHEGTIPMDTRTVKIAAISREFAESVINGHPCRKNNQTPIDLSAYYPAEPEVQE